LPISREHRVHVANGELITELITGMVASA